MNKQNKKKQLETINKLNPMHDNYHVGIRKIEDIKTLPEAFKEAKKCNQYIFDGKFSGSLYGDVSIEDYENSIKTKRIRIYSSHEIVPGTFVTPSFNQARDYAGNPSNVKTKEVNIDDVAWIDIEEGIYVGHL